MNVVHPFEALPGEGDPMPMSLLQFNNMFIELDVEHAHQNDQSNKLCLGLTGLNPQMGRRVIIEPLRNRLRRPYELDVSRDYDSLISFTEELPVTQDIYIYRMFHPTMTLKEKLHIKVRMCTQAGRPPQLVRPHKVPNVCIGQIGTRHCIRLFFPALMQPADGGPDLTEDQLAAVYDQGLYPAIQYLAPELATNWSPSYAAAKLRARNLNGTYQIGTHPFPGDTARRLGYTIKRYLQAALPWAMGCLWMVQIQGVKEAHTHASRDFLQSYTSFGSLVEGLIRDLVLQGQSWVDIGLQVSQENRVLQWRTDGHRFLAGEFGDLTQDTAARLCALPSNSYHRDYVAGLVDLSGFRATLNPNRTDNAPAYVQAYTTDKSLIAHLEAGRHGLFMRGKDAIHGDEDHTPAYCKRMMAIYQAGVRHTTAARVEARVPARSAMNSMLDFPEDLLERTLCQYSPVDWWQWRQIRITCIAETLALQIRAHPSLKYMREALNLTAALVWLANGLNSRPDDDQYGRDIMMTSCLTANSEFDQGTFLIQPPAHGAPGQLLPIVRQGAIFLRSICFPPTTIVPRFSFGMELNNATWIHVFRQTPEQLRLRALPPPYVPRRRLLEAGWVPTQKGMSRPHWEQIDIPLPEFTNLLFPLPPIPRDVAEDLPYEERVEYFGDMAQNLPVEMTHLWRQFLSDLMQKCGNLRGARPDASHCRLSPRERQNITQQTLSNPNLATIFNRVQYRRSTRKEWADAFDHYFSPLNANIPIQPQNFPNMLYWRRWVELKTLLPDAIQIGHVRRQMRVIFDQLLWVPQVASDRAWSYRKDDRFRMLPQDCTSNAPQIMMNPSSGPPQWDLPREGEMEGMIDDEILQPRYRGPQPIPYAHLRQEEEESSG